LKRPLAACAIAVLLALIAGCGGSTHRSRGPNLGSLAASGAGHRFYEIYEPADRPRGTMLMFHGGSWMDLPGDARRSMALASLAFRANGWRVVDVSYSPGYEPGVNPRPMLRDVVAFYDQVRRAYGGPICAYGESAGGHLAAMLAIERPSLTCAILNAAPLDLRTLIPRTLPGLASVIKLTFGTRRSMLDEWSPARLWRTGVDRTAVFATAASNDPAVPAQQLTAFDTADQSADGRVVAGANPGSAQAVPWMHSDVSRRAIITRVVSLGSWLDRLVPRHAGPPMRRATSIGADCADSPAPAKDRWKLMLAGDAWRQASTAGHLIAATRGCSGSARRQDDGLSLWALPSPGTVLPAGAQASLALQSARALRRLSVSFRGFLARPRDWVVGLYASSRTDGGTLSKVAACERGRCSGLRLVRTNAGALIAASGSHGDPDRRAAAPSADFALPPGTRRIVWQLRCAAPAGCSLAGSLDARGVSLRSRDPLGHPAILSLYRVDLR
jgi:hypothetical protein